LLLQKRIRGVYARGTRPGSTVAPPYPLVLRADTLVAMHGIPGPTAAARRRALWLFIALLPMLTFVGHWPTHVDLPGTNLYLTIPFAGPVDGAAAGHDHSQHCHDDAAGCSKTPATAGVGFALMNESLALLGAAALMLAVAAVTRRAPNSCEYAPDPGPPRLALSPG
jgi:hypothetical protein